MPAAAVQRPSMNLWKWLFTLSLPLAIFGYFWSNLNWGATDEGEVLYNGALSLSWPEAISQVFLPARDKVFLFGTFRPLPLRLYFKAMSSLGISTQTYNYIDWVASWVACLAFAWGIVALIRKAVPVAKEASWLIALLIWWTPTWLFCTNAIYVECWMQPGLMGLFWGFVFSSVEDLPNWARNNWIRYSIGLFCGFLACQSHEATVFMLGWTTLWLWYVSENRKKDWLTIALPSFLALFYVVLYRDFHSGVSNRPEIQISYAPIDMAHVSRYYWLIGLNGISKPFMSFLSLNPAVVGQSEAQSPIAFLLTLAGIIWALNPLRDESSLSSQENSRVRLLWLLVLGGVICTLPYLVMKNRSLIYYGLRLQIYLAALVGARAVWGVQKEHHKSYAVGVFLFIAGSIFASNTLMLEWNWLKHYGGISKQIYQRVIQMPGANECSSEHPCCLQFNPWLWVYNETTVNWNDGAPNRPRFVKPGTAACAKTLYYNGPYGWN